MCKGCNELKHIWKSDKKDKYCQSCWYNIQQPKTITKSTTKIAPISKKKKEEISTYNKLRDAFLFIKPNCEAKLMGCTGKSSDIHHMRGRGEYMLKIGTWLSVCRSCHSYIELHPLEAKELGFSKSRLNKEDDN
jgi:hypothetical protein